MTRFMSLVTKSMFALLIESGALATNMQAQSDVITVSVPFRFTIGTHSVAPGSYQFSLISSEFLLSVVDMKTGNREIFDVHPGQQKKPDERGRLVFRKSGDHKDLNEIHFPGAVTFSEVIEPHRTEERISARSATGNFEGVGQP